MNDSDKELIAGELEVMADSVRRLPNNPSDAQRYGIIKELFEIMVQVKES